VIGQAMELAAAAITCLKPDEDEGEESKFSLRVRKAALPMDSASEEWCQHLLTERRIEKFAIVTPAAGWPAKEWPAKNYGALATSLAAEGIATLVNIGPGAREQALGDELARTSGGAATVVQCTISQLIALTRRAALFFGGDTGPMHLAALLGIPTIALFGPTDPARNGPFYKTTRVLRNAASSTSYSHSQQTDAGLPLITAEEVLAAAHELLTMVTS
jgi:heptosyltransferase-1